MEMDEGKQSSTTITSSHIPLGVEPAASHGESLPTNDVDSSVVKEAADTSLKLSFKATLEPKTDVAPPPTAPVHLIAAKIAPPPPAPNTHAAASSAAPVAPRTRQAPSALLLSSQAAVDAMKRAVSLSSLNAQSTSALTNLTSGDGASAFRSMPLHEIPEVLAETKLLWSLCILRDPQIQALIRRCLAMRLADLLAFSGNKSSKSERGGDVTRIVPALVLPVEDQLTCLCVQLCQLSLLLDDQLHSLDPSLLRVQVPLLMFYAAEAKKAKEDAREGSSSKSVPTRDDVKALVDSLFTNDHLTTHEARSKERIELLETVCYHLLKTDF